MERGDIFGEIGLFTNLKRTCSVMADETCLVLKIDRAGINEIKSKFEPIFEKIHDNIKFYNDEDMILRYRFVQNIPYARKLSEETICKLVYKIIEFKNYEIGDLIL